MSLLLSAMIKFSVCITFLLIASYVDGQSALNEAPPPLPPRYPGGPDQIEPSFRNNGFDQGTNNNQFTRADVDNNGKVTFNEFLLSDRGYVEQQERNFKNFDINGDGFVTQQEYDNHNKRREEEEAESRRQQEKFFRELIAGFNNNNNNNNKFGQHTPQTSFGVPQSSFNFPPFLQGFGRSNESEANATDQPTIQQTDLNSSVSPSPSP